MKLCLAWRKISLARVRRLKPVSPPFSFFALVPKELQVHVSGALKAYGFLPEPEAKEAKQESGEAASSDENESSD
ncbi:hypothetical protein WJX77_011466 [Trebouxia sp. C0004]